MVYGKAALWHARGGAPVQGFAKVVSGIQPGGRPVRPRIWSARRGSCAIRQVSSMELVTPCTRNRVMTRLEMADQICGPFPVRSYVLRAQAGEVEHGIGPGVPLGPTAVLLPLRGRASRRNHPPGRRGHWQARTTAPGGNAAYRCHGITNGIAIPRGLPGPAGNRRADALSAALP